MAREVFLASINYFKNRFRPYCSRTKKSLKPKEESLVKELEKLSQSEKLILVEALWDFLISDPERVDLPEHHKTILEERLKSLETDKLGGTSQEEIRGK